MSFVALIVLCAGAASTISSSMRAAARVQHMSRWRDFLAIVADIRDGVLGMCTVSVALYALAV